jgi:arylsulfatase A-like enzyme
MIRPNILLITSDQQRADCNGFENPLIRTPHIDSLARDGTRFSACITPNLVCQPSRASILTGLLPLTHGVWDNGVDLDPAVGAQGFAGTLARAGYQTAFIGKAHFATKSTFAPTGKPECNKSQARYGSSWHGPYMGFEQWAVRAGSHAPQPPARTPASWPLRTMAGLSRRDEEGMTLGTGYALAPVRHRLVFRAASGWHNSTWIGDRAIAWLARQNDAQKPFCAWVSFPDPHHPFDCPEPWSLMYDPKDMVLPAHRARDLERRPWWHKASLENKPQLADPEMLKFRAEGSRVPDQSDAQLAEMTANYYGMISLIDHNVGRILTALDDLGVANDTLVIYTTDHGEMLGNQAFISRDRRRTRISCV